MRISRQNFARSSDLYSDEICCTVETVLCTTKTSAPASWAMAPNSAARCGIDRTATLDLPHPRPDQFPLHRFLINFLQEGSYFVLVRLDDFLEHFRGIFVARLDAFKIEHRQTAELAHFHGKTHVHHSIHGAGQDRNFQVQGRGLAPRQPKGSIDLVRIDRDAARDQRDLVETISHAGFSVTANPHSHIKIKYVRI